jgi:aminopeptidase N
VKAIRTLSFLLALLSSLEVRAAPLTHHDIKVHLNPVTGAIDLSDKITVQQKSEFHFRLASWLKMTKVLLDGKKVVPVRIAHGWRIILPNDADHSLHFDIKGTIPALPNRPSRAMTGGARAGAEGVFLPGYAAWVPDSGESQISYQVQARVPEPFRVVGTGQPKDNETFSAAQAVELPSLFAGPYEVTEQKSGDLRLRTYFHKGLERFAADYLRISEDYIRRYSKKIGTYPYSDFHIISSPLPVGLGFPNLTYVGRRVLALPFMRGRSLAHEVLHNWWGNGVAIDYDGGNWAEGLTTFMADYALAEDRGKDAARHMRLGWLRDFAALPRERDVPVKKFYGKRHDASQVVGYGKVAAIFHMLRDEVGAKIFNQAFRLFWTRHKFGRANWSDIQAAFEKSVGRNLNWFFDQWLQRPGAPKLSLGASRLSKKNDQHQLIFKISQAQPFYRLSVPVVIETGNEIVTKRLEFESQTKEVTLTFDDKPKRLSLDPNFDVFRRLLPYESPPILRDITLASDVVTLIAAEDAAMKTAAVELSKRLLDVRGQRTVHDVTEINAHPALIIGSEEKIANISARIKWADQNSRPSTSGSAWAWTRRRAGGLPVLIVAAKDAAALKALLRPLPHYRSRSFVVFKGRRAIERGIWPNSESPLTRSLGK